MYLRCKQSPDNVNGHWNLAWTSILCQDGMTQGECQLQVLKTESKCFDFDYDGNGNGDDNDENDFDDDEYKEKEKQSTIL